MDNNELGSSDQLALTFQIALKITNTNTMVKMYTIFDCL